MTKDIGIVLSGSVRVERADINGQRTVLGITGAGEVFAEAYACLEGMPMLVDAVANEDSTVLQLAADKLFSLGDRRAGSAVLKNQRRKKCQAFGTRHTHIVQDDTRKTFVIPGFAEEFFRRRGYCHSV